MDSVNDDAKGVGYGRIELLTGPGRRRKWSDDDKARIVAETTQPGAVVSVVARRWQVSPQQVFDWRRQARRALEAADAPAFVAIVPQAAAAMAEPLCPTPPVQLELAGAMLRVAPGTDIDLLTTVLRAIRASAP
jgi:transposase